jgi:hypothetical protein
MQFVNRIQCPTGKIEKSINMAFKLSGNIIELGNQEHF